VAFFCWFDRDPARSARQVGAGRNTAPPPVEDKGVVLRALKKGEIEQKSFFAMISTIFQ